MRRPESFHSSTVSENFRSSRRHASGSRRAASRISSAIDCCRDKSRTGTRLVANRGLSFSISLHAAPKVGASISTRVTHALTPDRFRQVARSDDCRQRSGLLDALYLNRASLLRTARRPQSCAGSSRSSRYSSGAVIRRRIVAAIPPAARPSKRPETTTRHSRECLTRASIFRSAVMNARSSPVGTFGMPPAAR